MRSPKCDRLAHEESITTISDTTRPAIRAHARPSGKSTKSERDLRAESAGHDRRTALLFAIRVNVYGLGLMALWNTLNTIVLPHRVAGVAPANLQGSAVGLVGLIGIGIAALVQPLAGRASDAAPRADRRRPFVLAGTLIAMPALALFGWAPGFALLLLGYLLLQIATNVAQAAFQAFIPDLVAERQRGIASGAKNALTVVGAAIGLVGARGLSALGAGDGIVLAYLATLLAITAGLTQHWAPVSPPPEEDASWGKALAALNPRAMIKSFARTAREHPTFRYAVIAQFCFLLGTYPAQRFLLLFLRDRFGDGAEERASLGLALAIVLAMLAAAVAGALSDAIGRRIVLLISAIAGAVGLAGIGFAPSLLLVAVAGATLAMATGAFQAVNWALMSDDIPAGQGAAAFGLANVATAGAGALAGLFGPLVDAANAVIPGGTYQITFGLAALIAAASVIPIRRIDQNNADTRPAG